MTTKLTTAITAAALAAFTAFAYTDKPKSNADETAALKARIEKLESDLVMLRAQIFDDAPVTNKDEIHTFNVCRLGDFGEFDGKVVCTGVVFTVGTRTISYDEPLRESDKLRIDEKKREYKEWINKRSEERDEKLRKEYGATKREWSELKKRTKSGSGVVRRRVLAEIRESNSTTNTPAASAK